MTTALDSINATYSSLRQRVPSLVVEAKPSLTPEQVEKALVLLTLVHDTLKALKKNKNIFQQQQ